MASHHSSLLVSLVHLFAPARSFFLPWFDDGFGPAFYFLLCCFLAFLLFHPRLSSLTPGHCYRYKIQGPPFLICLAVCVLYRFRTKLNRSLPSNIRVHGICVGNGGLVDTIGQFMVYLLAQYPTTNLAVLSLCCAGEAKIEGRVST